MTPFDPDKETAVEYIARLEATVNRLLVERQRLDRRIHNQRVALRLNWEIIEMRASHRRAWVRSPLLRDMLKRGTRWQQTWWMKLLGVGWYPRS